MKTVLLSFNLLLIAFISLNCDKDDGPIYSYGWNCGNKVFYAEKFYNTVQIGNKCWLKENLDVGRMVLGTDTAKNNRIIEKYCYKNDTANCSIYGGLYTLNEAMQYTTIPGVRGICPPWWHIPTYEEFQELITTADSDGNALKAIGQGWGVNTGTNTSGFSALLAGYRSHYGNFTGMEYGFFWGSTEGGYPLGSIAMLLYPSSSYVDLTYYHLVENGFSVRCIKD